MEGLRKYEAAFGQKINYQKFSMYFSPNTAPADREYVLSLLNIPQANQVETHLGRPSTVGRNKTSKFVYIKERIHKRIKGWNTRLLSRAAGKEILIKTCATNYIFLFMS